MMPRDILAALAKPFPADAISWRAGPVSNGRTKPLAYIDARDVQSRLDEVMGADWQCEFVPMANGTCCCRIGLKIEGEWRWRANGAGASDIEGEKGQYSDALKRAAVMWGVGTYLYNISAPWCEMEGKQIKASEHTKLQALLNRNAKPLQSEPAGRELPGPSRQMGASGNGDAPAATPKPATPSISERARPKPPMIPTVERAPASLHDAAGRRTSGELRATAQPGNRNINNARSMDLGNKMLLRLSWATSLEMLAAWDAKDGMNHADWKHMNLADQKAVEGRYRDLKEKFTKNEGPDAAQVREVPEKFAKSLEGDANAHCGTNLRDEADAA